MSKPFPVHQRKRPQYLGRDLEELIFGQRLAVQEIPLQVSVFTVFHSHVEPTRNLVPAEELDEVVGILLYRTVSLHPADIPPILETSVFGPTLS